MAKKRKTSTRARSGNGRFKKRGTVALTRRGTTAPARRTRTRTRTITVRRRSSGGSRGGSLGQIGAYLGGVTTAEVLTSGGLGLAIKSQRATVDKVLDYAPESLRAVGGYGVIALMAGIANHMGFARKFTKPIARVATIIAVNKLTTRGAWYEPGEYGASLSGDGDDDVGEDELDVSGLAVLEGQGQADDDVGDDED